MGGFLSHLQPEPNSEVLNATCGPIKGNIYEHGEKIVDGYLGIPFAKAPVGELRFKKPVAAEKWNKPRECYKYGPGCPQSGVFGMVLSEHFYLFFKVYFLSQMIPKGLQEFAEDNCLTLSVFAPRWKNPEFKNGFPVMVYFYAGAFEVGSSTMCDYSLSGTLPLKDVIIVTPNYRVGPLGFLTTGDDVAKGNYGLWDQTLALKWVQEHIQSFGGDPDNVTIFGTSAGAASVDMLALSPHSNKLFRRLIAMSGSAYNDFAIRPKELQAKIFRSFAEHHGFSGKDSQSLLAWYESQDPEKFIDVATFERPASGCISFGPNFDGDFFPKPFDELRRDAPKKDVMITVGEFEGLIYDQFFPPGIPPMKVFSSVYGNDLTSDPKDVAEKVLEFYMKNTNAKDTNSVIRRVVEFVGDAWFNIGALETVKSCTKYGATAYIASFDYFNQQSSGPMVDRLAFRAATHGSELKYILGSGGMAQFNPTEEELQVMDIMGSLLTNFAKTGNPNGETSTLGEVQLESARQILQN
ncbi:hypothetical protein CAEBREN_24495 [Caenorhabditis brenneri]|uniref:Carboxylic ester hydrolase n=1 Tax=Caenorhabditis brenneri TaxID=135651 RepID=G0NEM9_CAEBE|nr:hypothetical protein CAEBREN_24495 [Caenorhabditis brenneri]